MSGLVCRLIFDPPGSGAWNMAVDEALLHGAAAGRPTLRFYTWREATLSLGYFQGWQTCAAYVSGGELGVVRRPTGGSAIVHGSDLSYALALGARAAGQGGIAALYRAVHQALVQALARLGVSATLAAVGARGADARAAGLCMAAISSGDVLMGGVKIAGSAQRRRGPAVLQHGSVLLRPSACGVQPPGIAGMGGPALEPMALAGVWSLYMAEVLGLAFQAAGLEPAERQTAVRLERERYLSTAWTQRR
jgi:lipoate-protein ligase A